MKLYIGVKLIKAEPEVKNGEEGYKVEYPDGYVSWSPKAAFEDAYVALDGGEEHAKSLLNKVRDFIGSEV